MNPLTVLIGDCRETLKTLPDESVQCCVTSPPYWGLRDYGTAKWEGGDPECDHQNKHGLQGASGERADRTHTGSQNFYKDVCAKCGAVRIDEQIGLEKTPELFVANMVQVFREVRRVLRSDGTLWLNLGDSYANDAKWGGSSGGKHVSALHGKTGIGRQKVSTGLKPKDLVGMPWMVAFALRADGWYLRSDIIWHKPNPMPESVTDRPTKAHEYIFLLTKSERYFYDAEAIKEDVSGTANARRSMKTPDGWDTTRGEGGHGSFHKNGREKGRTDYEHKRAPGVGPKSAAPGSGIKMNDSFSASVVDLVSNRNKRSVWTVATAPYSEAHFATFPPKLIAPCIAAGTSSRGCCPACGTPWTRIMDEGEPDLEHQRQCGGDSNGEYFGESTKDYAVGGAQDASATKARILAGMKKRRTIDWEPGCKCGRADTVPCVVLDPFGGSGTTGKVAIESGRHAILCELNPEYGKLIDQRTETTLGLAL